MECNSKYIHFYPKDLFDNLEDAKARTVFYRDLITHLSEAYCVYVRKEPDYQSNRRFETNTPEYVTSTRFSIEVGGKIGKQAATTTYDNNDMIFGFGLINNGNQKA